MSAFAGVLNDMPLAEATQHMKSVPIERDIMLMARDLGICFGN